MTPPRTLLMTADAIGGVWTYALDLATALAPLGVRTTLVVIGPRPSPEQRRRAQAIEGLELIETDLPLDWTAGDAGEVLASGAAVGRLARKRSPDIVQLNSPALAAGGAFTVPTVGVCHSCLATWWSAVKGGVMPDDFRWRTDLTARGLANCDWLAAPSGAFASQVAATYGMKTPHVVHNGRPSRIASGRREPIAITSGRLWDEGKNVVVLDAAALMCRTPIYAAGPVSGPSAGDRIELAAVQALGALGADLLDSWLGRASVYVSCALYEPFGLGVLEAAQAGCALVLSDIPTFRELWDGAAVFVDPRSPEAFALHVDSLIETPLEADRLGGKARARAARYSAAAMAGEMLALYRTAGTRLAEVAHA
jgi:glycogen(starch) synthase